MGCTLEIIQLNLAIGNATKKNSENLNFTPSHSQMAFSFKECFFDHLKNYLTI